MPQLSTWKEEWNPHSYQQDAVKFALTNPNVLLLADPGMGKTSIALSTISILKSKGFITKTLVVAPKRPALKSWPDELAKWTNFKNLTYTLIHSGNKEKAIKEDVDIYIITTDLVGWLYESIKPASKRQRSHISTDRVNHLDLNYLIIDELSKFKNMTSNRTKVMKEVSKLFPRRIGLTGSFAPNNLTDVFSETLIIAGDTIFGKYITNFKSKFFDKLPTYGRNFEKLTPKPDAYERICKALSPVTVHLKCEDYLDMPDILYTDIMVDIPPSSYRMYKEMEQEYITMFNNKEITTHNAATKAMSLRQIASGGIYTYEKIPIDEERGVIEMQKITNVVHNAKTDALKDLISELQGQPLIILYHFKHDKERIKTLLGDVPDITDASTPEKLDNIVDAWNNGELPLMLGQPQSMGHGLNLQEGGHHVCFYTVDWSFENYDQAIRRLYRQGNKSKTVYVYHLLAQNTIDNYVLKCVQDKCNVQNEIFGYLKQYCEERKAL